MSERILTMTVFLVLLAIGLSVLALYYAAEAVFHLVGAVFYTIATIFELFFSNIWATLIVGVSIFLWIRYF